MQLSLAELPVGASAIIRHIDGDSAYARKLLLLGLTPGTRIAVQRKAPLGDPIQVSIRGSSLSLRRNEVSIVQLEAV